MYKITLQTNETPYAVSQMSETFWKGKQGEVKESRLQGNSGKMVSNEVVDYTEANYEYSLSHGKCTDFYSRKN